MILRVKSLSVALLSTFIAAGALAAPPKPTQFLQTQVDQVRALLKVPVKKGTPEAVASDQKLRSFIDPIMEFEKLSERALQKHWAGLTEAQRAAFIGTFRDLVFRSYLQRVRSADEQYTLAYEDESVRGDRAVVSAVAKTKQAEIELVFHLEAREGSRWVAADVVIDEVSLVENYRDQFNKIIAEESFDALLQKMRNKLDELGGPLPPQPGAVAAPPTAPPGASMTAVPGSK